MPCAFSARLSMRSPAGSFQRRSYETNGSPSASARIQVDHRRIHEPARLGVEHKARGTAEQRVGASVDVSAGCRDLGSRRPAGTHSRARRRAGPGSSARRGIPLQRLHGTAQLFQRLLLQRRHTLQLLLVLLAPPVREQHLALEEVGLGLLGVLFRGIALPLGGVDVLAGLAVLLVTHDLLHLEGPHIAGLPLLLLLRHLHRSLLLQPLAQAPIRRQPEVADPKPLRVEHRLHRLGLRPIVAQDIRGQRIHGAVLAAARLVGDLRLRDVVLGGALLPRQPGEERL
mmetsp:Transcript_10710/g.31907  ORF Transcript_10710/g.31907 Transcript_10710/m.31907 type:complete len:285 (-) Transcript_10710:2829-3683(-)